MGGQAGRLGRADRLRKGRDFRRVARTGRRAAGPHFVLLLAAGDSHRTLGAGAARSRLGVTVSRKVGNAVQRNYVKRRIRDWFRHGRGRLEPGSDLVVIARRGAAQLEGRRMAAQLCQVAGRLAGERP